MIPTLVYFCFTIENYVLQHEYQWYYSCNTTQVIGLKRQKDNIHTIYFGTWPMQPLPIAKITLPIFYKLNWAHECSKGLQFVKT